MASNLDFENWNQYVERQRELFRYGIQNGLIYPYEIDDDFMSRLRDVYDGGIRLSVLVLWERMCNGYCYDRALLPAFGFRDQDFRKVYAVIDGLYLNPYYIDEYSKRSEKDQNSCYRGEHCFMECTHEDGTVWVYEPSFGLVYRQDLYYEIEKPRINRELSKREILESFEYQQTKDEDIELSKYGLFAIIPSLEMSLLMGQTFHMDALRKELELFKADVDYDAICKEERNNMKRMGLFV